ncbi:MAG: alpha/beta hydrolase [Geminicoccaceae bacterium]|nr:alpha/beta hydrolase [Geminicoccaceae bacterium]
MSAIGGCSATELVNDLVPEDGYEIERDIAYGADPRQTLDLYRPDEIAPSSPLVVFFYGGRWQSGAKEDFLFVGQALASRGYLTAIVDYRLYPQVRWQGFLEDGADAVAFLAERVAEQDESRPVVLAGHSAGGYIAAMVALNQERRRAAGIDRCTIAGAIGLAGPYDFLPLEANDLREIFGPGEAGPETQPIAYVDPDDPPMLLLHGLDDETVLPKNSRNLAAALEDAGVPVTAHFYKHIDHIELVGSLASSLRFLAPTLDDMDRFLADLPSPRGCPRP